MTTQQGDVCLFQTPDDGEISIENGIALMVGGLGVAAYLSIFGGNEDDDGRPNNPNTYWGNRIETTPEREYISRTQFLLRTIPATSSNLLRIQQAVELDLKWMLTGNIASNIEVTVTIPNVNTIKIVIDIIAFGEQSSFTFTENWKAQT